LSRQAISPGMQITAFSRPVYSSFFEAFYRFLRAGSQKPFGLSNQSVSTDFHELRQGFIPPDAVWLVQQTGSCPVRCFKHPIPPPPSERGTLRCLGSRTGGARGQAGKWYVQNLVSEVVFHALSVRCTKVRLACREVVATEERPLAVITQFGRIFRWVLSRMDVGFDLELLVTAQIR
jgi:hypothetical protein